MRGNHIGVRKGLISVFVLAGVMAMGVAGVASALKLTTTTVRAGNLQVTFGGGIHQRTLPKHRFEAFKHTIFGTIKTTDGTHPSAFRELVLDVDKDVKINTKGFPVCRAGQLEARDTKSAKRVCGKTIVGEGSATAEIAFPEQAPIKVLSPLLVFNGGERGGKITLLVHTFITVPAPAAIVTTVTVQRKGTGVHAIAKIPVIAGGSGSAVRLPSSRSARPTATSTSRSATSRPGARTASSRCAARRRSSRMNSDAGGRRPDHSQGRRRRALHREGLTQPTASMPGATCAASGKSLRHLNPKMTAEEPERGGPGSLSFSRAASRYRGCRSRKQPKRERVSARAVSGG